jgi:hypothetical protein
MDNWLTDATTSPYSSYEEGGISRESSWPTNMSLRDSGEEVDDDLDKEPPPARTFDTDFLDLGDTQNPIPKSDHVFMCIGNGKATPPLPKKPLNLLDLPVDMLEAVVRQVSPNPLLGLALSKLDRSAQPMI